MGWILGSGVKVAAPGGAASALRWCGRYRKRHLAPPDRIEKVEFHDDEIHVS
jgi:hypothetical protein